MFPNKFTLTAIEVWDFGITVLVGGIMQSVMENMAIIYWKFQNRGISYLSIIEAK